MEKIKDFDLSSKTNVDILNFLKDWDKFKSKVSDEKQQKEFFIIKMKTIYETFYYANAQHIDWLITEKMERAHNFNNLEDIDKLLSKPFFIENVVKENGNMYPPAILSLVGKINKETNHEIVNLSILKIKDDYQIIETIFQKDIELKVIKPIGIKYLYE